MDRQNPIIHIYDSRADGRAAMDGFPCHGAGEACIRFVMNETMHIILTPKQLSV